MSVPNLTNNMIQQPQSIVINQVPLSHAIMTNVNSNNGMNPIAHGGASTVVVDQSNAVHENMSSGVQQQTVVVQQQQQPSIISNNIKSMSNSQQSTSSSSASEPGQVLTKQRLQDLIRDTDSTLNLEEEIEEIILNYVDEFVDRCLNGAALIAKNRRVSTIEVKDVQQFLNRNYNMWTPGFGTDELRPYKRSLTTEAHKQRLALIRKSLKKY